MNTGICYSFILLFFIFSSSFSQNYTKYNIDAIDNPSPGYFLIGPLSGSQLSLHDNLGNSVYSKDISSMGSSPNAFRLLSTGNLAFFTSSTWYILDNKFNIIDKIKATKPYKTNFHTLRTSPTGNYLLAADQIIHVDMREKVAGGNSEAQIANIIIQEFDSQKNLVFEWNCYEHIDITDATEDVNLTFADIDPYHINSADYDWDGNIIANFRNLDAIIKINRSTGAIMWVWGGSKSKKNQFTFINDTENGFTGFSHQHDPKRLPNGNILLFDNGVLKPKQSSRAVEYQIDEATKTARKVWEYHYTPAIYSEFQGNAQRLPNGNTLIGWGNNTSNKLATEVTSQGKIAIDMSLRNNPVSYQVLKYPLLMNTVSHNINSKILYGFNDDNNITGISLNISSLTGFGIASIEKHDYSASSVSFISEQACSYLPKRWVLNYRNISSISGKMYFSTNEFWDIENKEDLKVFWRETEGIGSFKLLNTVYNSQFNRLEADFNNHGEFIIGIDYNPAPMLYMPTNNQANIAIHSNLSWKDAAQSNSYVIQVSEDFSFTNIVFDSIVVGSKYVVCNFPKHFTKYYWRVKGNVTSCDKIWSETFSFVTEIGQANLLLPKDKSIDLTLDVELNWEQISGATAYVVQVSEDSTFKSFFISENNASLTSYQLDNLKPYSKYYWRILGEVDEKVISTSKTYSFMTKIVPIELNRPLNKNPRTPFSGNLIWHSLNKIIKYQVQLSEHSDYNTLLLDSIVAQQNQIHYEGLKSSTTYYWRVKGFFKDTLTEWSETRQFRTKIGRTALLLPKDGSTDNKSDGKFEWFSLVDAVNYHIQISDTPTFDKIVKSIVTDSSTFVFYENINWNSTFYWRVRAYDGNEFGAWSDYYTFSTLTELVSPSNNSYKIPVEVNLEWNPTHNSDYYEIKISQDSLFKDIKMLYSSFDNNKYVARDLLYNTCYYWSIRAKKGDNFTNWSTPFQFTTQLEPPKALYPNDIIFTSNFSPLTFNWTNTLDKEHYHLQIAFDKSFNNLIIDSSSLTYEVFEYNTTLADSLYYWRVSALNSLNASNWSEMKSFRLAPISTNIDEYGNMVQNKLIHIYPNPASIESNFSFILEKKEFVKLSIITAEGKETTIIVNDLLPEGNYFYKLELNKYLSGMYYYTFQKGGLTESGKLLIIK